MNAVDTLLAGLIDYAGLFPPASQKMAAATESYAAYFSSAEREILGRFIVTATRLPEFEFAAQRYLATGPESEPWRLSVIIGDDTRAAAEQVVAFNKKHRPGSDDGNAVIEAVELKAATSTEVTTRCAALPRGLRKYVEIPIAHDLRDLVSAIAAAGASAKVRAGGITPDAFPSSAQLADVMIACRDAGVAFKATAGLHHPLRGNYRLTYEPGSAEATMYGYINVFIAAALVYRRATRNEVVAILEETDPVAFSFTDEGIDWRGLRVTADEIAEVRAGFANSFGSCSFREPVDEIRELTSIASQ